LQRISTVLVLYDLVGPSSKTGTLTSKYSRMMERLFFALSVKEKVQVLFLKCGKLSLKEEGFLIFSNLHLASNGIF
jgi:hypothetical protein